jgi:diaminopimelate decarboxylase
MECGRAITGPYGYLVSRVLHIKNIYKKHVGLDANMAHLMRPAMYGAYHHITVIGKEKEPHEHIYDVTGSLCEPIDRFAIDRALPKIDRGDLLVIHDTGAHGHALGFNYNGKLRSSELLLRENGEVIEIRKAETVEDYFTTLDFNKLAAFQA